jgi:hypothetical protein
MAKREDEYYRQEYYGGHPPACTCVKCTRRRLAGIERGRSAEKTWLLVLLAVCLVSAGWTVWLLASGSVRMTVGLVNLALDLGVLAWGVSAWKSPWGSFRSGLTALIIVLVSLIVSLAG